MEQNRLKMWDEAKKGHLTRKQAGTQLILSEHLVRKLVGRLRPCGEERRRVRGECLPLLVYVLPLSQVDPAMSLQDANT
jgi:hypothetical protein